MSAKTYSEIYEILSSVSVTTGGDPIPAVFNFWEIGQVPDLPYIVFTYPMHNDYRADNRNYLTVAQLQVELYTKRKDLAVEAAVESVLSQHWIYDKASNWLDADDMQQTLYTMEVMIKYGE